MLAICHKIEREKSHRDLLLFPGKSMHDELLYISIYIVVFGRIC